jgi:PD-(D/E)XK nuclease superfamily
VIRAISYTEGSTMLRCQAQWDFQYGDRLAGSSLKQKDTPAILREGRAWGVGVASLWQAWGADPEAGRFGRAEMLNALETDAQEQVKAGVYDGETHKAMEEKMVAIFDHYVVSADGPLRLERPEHEMLVRLPSRSGSGWSNRYKLHTFFDGLHTDEHGRVWIVEFKLRGKLSSLEQIANSRQIRYYAWAWFIETGQRVAGVIVDERLNEIPKQARWVKPKRKEEGIEVDTLRAEALGAPYSEAEEAALAEKGTVARRAPSHAKDQLTTPDLYEGACLDAGEGPHIEVMEALESRRWQQRVPIFLTDAEIDEAGRELVSLARQIQALDAHDVYPVRDVRAQNCNGCRFRDICNHPDDTDLVEALFDRVPPKRDRSDIDAKQQEEATMNADTQNSEVPA